MNVHELRAAPGPSGALVESGCSRSWCCASTGSAPVPSARGGVGAGRHALHLGGRAAERPGGGRLRAGIAVL